MNVRAWVGGRFVDGDFDRSANRFIRSSGTSAQSERYLVPGLVDAHCHGVGGLDVMDGKAAEIAEKLRAVGVEYLCPTTVTTPWEELRFALQACDPAVQGFAGVHLEGPFVNPAMAGAQPKEHIAPPSARTLEEELGDLLSRVKIVTLAPELDGAQEVIGFLRGRGIAVSAGHTDATFETLRARRISRMTHFYNAMRPFHHREPGCVGYGLLGDPELELIYDGIHVSAQAVDLLLQSRGLDGLVAVSDGTSLSGLPDGTVANLWGHRVTKRDGAVRLDDGTLAGSAATLADVFRRIWEDFGPEVAVRSASDNPRRSLGLPEPRLWLIVSREGDIIEPVEMELAIS